MNWNGFTSFSLDIIYAVLMKNIEIIVFKLGGNPGLAFNWIIQIMSDPTVLDGSLHGVKIESTNGDNCPIEFEDTGFW